MTHEYSADRETKNTVKFRPLTDNAAITAPYIEKSALKELGYEPGDTIIITIERKDSK